MVVPLPPAYVTMSNWNIVVVVYKGQIIEKFLGYSEHDRHYRISSQILEYDAENNTGRTVSGSIYRLLGKPGQLHPHAQKAFEKMCHWPEVQVSLKYGLH